MLYEIGVKKKKRASKLLSVRRDLTLRKFTKKGRGLEKKKKNIDLKFHEPDEKN